MDDVKSFAFIINRCKELEGQYEAGKWPTQYDLLKVWLHHLNDVVANIRDTSLNKEDEMQRGHQLMQKLLKPLQ